MTRGFSNLNSLGHSSFRYQRFDSCRASTILRPNSGLSDRRKSIRISFLLPKGECLSIYVGRQLFNVDILLWKRNFNSMFSKFSVNTTQQ